LYIKNLQILMRKYFIKDGDIKKGPFNLEQLKLQSIQNDSPIWFEELDQWVTASEIEELEEYLQAKNTNTNHQFFAAMSATTPNMQTINDYTLSMSDIKIGNRTPISLAVLIWGILIIGAIMLLTNLKG
jgi:hypothetical protein